MTWGEWGKYWHQNVGVGAEAVSPLVLKNHLRKGSQSSVQQKGWWIFGELNDKDGTSFKGEERASLQEAETGTGRLRGWG